MARKCFVGFWPWPRAWTTEEAYATANCTVKDAWSIHLAEPVTEAQAAVFRTVTREHITPEFEMQLCADGLVLYRENAIEDAIVEAAEIDRTHPDPMFGGFDAIMSASSAGYRHYIPALNILFALLESEMHSHGRNDTLYWGQPIGRTDMVRVKYAQLEGEVTSLTNFGDVNEMQLQRYPDQRSVGARMDGMYCERVPPAFADACVIFEQAYGDPLLWSFLIGYANAWSNLQTELYESSLALSWSLIERDLVRQTATLVAGLPQGGIHSATEQGVVRNLAGGEENRLRAKLLQGESPMAGKMIGILAAHNIPVHNLLSTVKQARNDNQHQASLVDPARCRDALTICSEIGVREFNVDLNCRLQANGHLGITC